MAAPRVTAQLCAARLASSWGTAASLSAPRVYRQAAGYATEKMAGFSSSSGSSSALWLKLLVPSRRAGEAARRSFSSTASAFQQSGGEQPPSAKPSRWYLLVEDAKDVLAVTFGTRRQRDVGKEVDMGLREYAWVSYEEPGTGRVLYRNTETGLMTEMQPSDWEQRSRASSRLTVNTEATAVSVVAGVRSPWERTLDSLYRTPIITGLLEVGQAVADSPVGQAAGKVKAKIDDAKEAALEKWETSQHP